MLHRHGEYEYRNPDSVYIHRFDRFSTREAALDYVTNRIAPAERHEWRLFQAEAVTLCDPRGPENGQAKATE